MNNPILDQWLEASRASLGPALRWQEIAADAAQKLIQHNLAVSRDALEYGNRQWQLLGEVKEPQKLATEGGKNATDFGRKMVDRGAEFFRIAKDTQDAVATWTDQSAKTAADSLSAKPAAAN